MREILYGLKLSFSYFSILPVKFKKILQSKKINASFLFFIPFVGAVLAVLASFSFLFLKTFMPTLYSAIFSASLYFFIYGFLHLEAVIDTIDALFAYHSQKDAYQIMKEPTVGAMGVIFIILFLILKIALISYLFINNLFLEFVTASLLSRLSIIIPIKYFSIHKKSFLANSLKKALSNKLFIDMILLYTIFAFVFVKTKLFAPFLLALFSVWFLSSYLYKKFGFINGDILGFIIEMCEFVLLNSFLIVS